ncbi:hypothetical protein B0H17DRAFT_951220, partial [Mycena rosella]
PDTQKKVHEEIHRVVGKHRMLTLDDFEHMPYIRAMILEVDISLGSHIHPVFYFQTDPSLLPSSSTDDPLCNISFRRGLCATISVKACEFENPSYLFPVVS